MIDYLTLLLVNMAAGHAILAAFVVKGVDQGDQRHWAPAFGLVGLIALGFGTYMTLTWPVIGPFNMAFGEMSVLFGGLFLGAAYCVRHALSFTPLAAYGAIAGVAALFIGARIHGLGLTKEPLMTTLGFGASGLSGVLLLPVAAFARDKKVVRGTLAALLLAGAALWAVTGLMAYWGHMASFADWKPLTMR